MLQKYLSEKVTEASLHETFIKGNSVRIGRAFEYEQSSASAAAAAGFMPFQTSSTWWDYMHAYEGALEKAGVGLAKSCAWYIAYLGSFYRIVALEIRVTV